MDFPSAYVDGIVISRHVVGICINIIVSSSCDRNSAEASHLLFASRGVEESAEKQRRRDR